MMDQVSKYSLKGLATQFVGEAEEDYSVISRVLEGEYQLVFISPEALLRRNRCYPPARIEKIWWLLSYVDEAHDVCISAYMELHLFLAYRGDGVIHLGLSSHE